MLLTTLAFPTLSLAQDVRRDDRPEDTPPPPKLTRAPELLEATAPVYPPAAAAEELEATVVVRISIDKDGVPTKVEVKEPVGNGFDEAAVAAAQSYRFRPAEFDGKPAPIVVEIPIHFRFEKVEVDVPPDQPAPGINVVGKLRIRGVVKERGTRRKLPGVALGVAGTNIEVTSDAGGRFVIEGLKAGTIRLIALASGYDRFTAKIEIKNNEDTSVSVYLRPRGASPYETTVEGEREKLEVTRHTINRKMMTSVPGTFGDPLRVLQNLPGMARSPFGTGFLLIRGTSPADSGVYIDGHQVPLLYHFLGGPSILNAEFLDEINLYPGGFPARFGRALGGIIEVETRSTESDGVHGAVDIDLLDAGLYLRAPITKNISVAAAGRRSYIDAILPAVLPEPSEGEILVVVPVYWDYQAKLDIKLPGNDHFSLLAFGSDDRLEVLSTNTEDDETIDLGTHIGFHRVRARYVTTVANGLKLSLSQVAGRDVVTFRGGERSSLQIKQTVVGLRERLSGKVADNIRIDTGIDLDYRITDYRLLAAIGSGLPQNMQIDLPVEELRTEVDAYQLAFYGDAAWDVGQGVRLIPGLRLDTYLLDGKARLSVDPRLVARWQLSGPTTLKAHIGLFHQPPPPEGFDSQFGNPDLLVEQAVHTGIGVEHQITPRISVEVEAYYAGRRNMASFTSEVEMLDNGTIRPIFWKSQATGRTFGVDLLLKHDLSKNFFGWIAYTLSNSMIQRDPDEPATFTFFDQTHNFTLVASYRTNSAWEFGVRFRVVSGRPDTPFEGGTYNSDDDVYVPLMGEPLSVRRQLFSQLDVRIEKTWLFKTWMIAAYLDVTNVYNAENPEATQYDYRFRDKAPIRGLPIVPTLGIRGQW